MSYILNILICVGMILLDSLVQCFLFIIMIDLSSTFDNTVVLICNLLFIIYFWIKIKLKVLIFLTIQKTYFRQFSFLAEFVDALKSAPFTGVHFKR
jgi:hypothetical protein